MPSSSGPFYPPHWIIHRKFSDSLTPFRRSNRIFSNFNLPSASGYGLQRSAWFLSQSNDLGKDIMEIFGSALFYERLAHLFFFPTKYEDTGLKICIPAGDILELLPAFSRRALVGIYLAWRPSGEWKDAPQFALHRFNSFHSLNENYIFGSFWSTPRGTLQCSCWMLQR